MMDMNNVRFRGKSIQSLTREELIDALTQSLTELARRDWPTLIPGFDRVPFPRSHRVTPDDLDGELNGRAASIVIVDDPRQFE